MSKFTRRETLARGGQAVAAAAVLSTLPTIAHAEDDAELFALYDEYRRLEKDYGAAEARASEAAFAVRRAFREPPTLSDLLEAVDTPGSPEREVFKAHCDDLMDAVNATKAVAKGRWDADLAKAEERAGVPALKKTEDAACDAWLGTLHRFLAMRAKTPAGMILKFRIGWCDVQEQSWQNKHSHRDVEFWDDAMASVLMDLERLARGAA